MSLEPVAVLNVSRTKCRSTESIDGRIVNTGFHAVGIGLEIANGIFRVKVNLLVDRLQKARSAFPGLKDDPLEVDETEPFGVNINRQILGCRTITLLMWVSSLFGRVVTA